MTEKKEEKRPLDLTTDEAIDFLFGEEAAEKLREEAHKGDPPPEGESVSRARSKSQARKHDNR